jgi:hypothetical protein
LQNHPLPPTPVEAAAVPSASPTLGLSMFRRIHSGGVSGMPGASHRIRLVPHCDLGCTHLFEPICCDLKEGDPALHIGRFKNRVGMEPAAANVSSNKLVVKSCVILHAHAEIWVKAGGNFFIKDTASSSGTFLNHIRLSPAHSKSNPHQIKDRDILQLGVNYEGGTEDMYKCFRIWIEEEEWQAGVNAFKYVFVNWVFGVQLNLLLWYEFIAGLIDLL